MSSASRACPNMLHLAVSIRHPYSPSLFFSLFTCVRECVRTSDLRGKRSKARVSTRTPPTPPLFILERNYIRFPREILPVEALSLSFSLLGEKLTVRNAIMTNGRTKDKVRKGWKERRRDERSVRGMEGALSSFESVILDR